jgi:hypothetical protein
MHHALLPESLPVFIDALIDGFSHERLFLCRSRLHLPWLHVTGILPAATNAANGEGYAMQGLRCPGNG